MMCDLSHIGQRPYRAPAWVSSPPVRETRGKWGEGKGKEDNGKGKGKGGKDKGKDKGKSVCP